MGNWVGIMKTDADDWRSTLKRPSMPLSLSATLIGLWGILLSFINLIFGAYSPGRKVLWPGFLFKSGDSNTEVMDIVSGDILFLVVNILLCALGIMGIRNSMEKREKGDNISLIVFLQSNLIAFRNNSTTLENGIMKALSCWLIIMGIIFYVAWCSLYNTWVDPGVYSVMITFIAFGIGLNILDDSNN